MSNIVGQCTQMCPPKEITLREYEKLLHPLEILPGTEKQKRPTADPSRTIKCFSRSAAGATLMCPEQLRPPSTLYKTVEYILNNVINDSRFTSICVYDFAVDRFRSISQDMVVQCLAPEHYVKIYEPIVKFYVLYGYKLCEEDVSKFDPYLHKKHFLEYLKRLLVCYDDVENDKRKKSCIVDKMKNLEIENASSDSKQNQNCPNAHKISNQPLFEAIYMLSNIGDTNVLLRYLNLSRRVKTPALNLAFQISLHYIKGNFVKVCEMLPKLHVLVQCAVYLQMPLIRKSALRIMNVAFHSKNLSYPLESLKNILIYDEPEQLFADCQFYGIKVNNGNDISFNKDSFNNSSMVSTKKTKIIDKLLDNMNMSKLLLSN